MRARRDICLGTLADLPPWSKGRRDTLDQQLSLLKDHGYEGVTHWSGWDAIRAAGLTPVGMGRIVLPQDALALATAHQDLGLDFTTVHVGTGFETDAEMDALAAAVVEATARTGHALHVETHRGTMTQDIRRTIDLVGRFPDLRLTLDFSHWYTGHEMTYGGEFAARLARLDPVFAQVRSVQIRVGDTGRIQRPLDPLSAFHADHMAALERCCVRLRRLPAPPDILPIAPELLAAKMADGAGDRWICYAEEHEASDRFADALDLSARAAARVAAAVPQRA